MFRDTKKLWRVQSGPTGFKLDYFNGSERYDCGLSDQPIELANILEFIEYYAGPNDMVSVDNSLFQVKNTRAKA